MTSNPWQWWQDALEGRFGPINLNKPEQGYYRINWPMVGGALLPIIYWYTPKGTLKCAIGEKPIDNGEAIGLWSRASKHPISITMNDHWVAHKTWPDQSEAVTRSLQKQEPPPAQPASRSQAVDAPPAAGDNAPPPEGSWEWFRDLMDDLVREAEKLIAAGPAKTKAEADAAADLSERLSKFDKAKPADLAANDPALTKEMRETVDRYKIRTQLWVNTKKKAEIFATLKQVVITPFLSALKKKADADAKAEAARRAEAIRTGAPVEVDMIPKAMKTTVGGSRGRAVHLVPMKFAVIADYDVVLKYFADHDKVKDLIQVLATAAVRAHVTPPGCTVDERDVAV